jgi:hypothetical protein
VLIVYGNATELADPEAVPVQTTFPVPVPLTTTKPFVPLQIRGSVGANVITGIGFIVTVPEADALTQPVVGFVRTTLYIPFTVAVKLEALPGFVAPAGTVHA